MTRLTPVQLNRQHLGRQAFVLGGTLLALLVAASPALAHHAMGGEMPATVWQGLGSGLTHPLIGLDHLAFVVAVGLLAATQPQGVWLPITFSLSALGGTALHLAQITLPGSELGVAGSVLLVGLLLALGRRWSSGVTLALVTLAGLLHGYAYGKSILGAEPTPLLAYLIGFTAIQLGLSMTAFWLAHSYLARNEAQAQPKLGALKAAGWLIAGIGISVVLGHLGALWSWG